MGSKERLLVVVVDDDSTMVAMIEYVFARSDHEIVHISRTLPEALAVAS